MNSSQPISSQWSALKTAARTFISVCLVAGLLSVAPAQTLKKLALAPSSVAGGSDSTGTVTLSKKAGSAGAVITLGSSNGAATVPGSVTVPSGATSASFTVKTTTVSVTTTATISGTLGTSSAKANLTIQTPKVTTLSFNPSSVGGGEPSTGTVVITSPAGSNGITVTLSGNSSVWGGPSSVTVPSGATSANFQFTTQPVSAKKVVKVTAKLGSTSTSANLTIEPPTLSSISFDPATITGGGSSTGTITLSAAAPTGGVKITVKSGSSVVQTPTTVIVPFGQASTTFQATTSQVSSSSNVTITAKLGTLSTSATLTVEPVSLSGLTVNPSSLIGGAGATGTVTLNGPAPSTGVVVTLNSNQGSVSVPANVPIPSGSSSATFSITTQSVTQQVVASITASLTSTSVSASLTVNPIALTNFTLSPTSLVGGAGATGTLTIGQTAPAAGVTVTVTSSNAAASAPTFVTIAQGQTSTTFTVTTQPVASAVTSTITATAGGASIGVGLNIAAASLSSLTLNPTTVNAGTNSSGTVTLSGAAPSAGTVITLSSNQAAASVPASVTVAAGATSATFTVKTSGVSANTTATITAKDPSGNSETAQLTVQVQQEIVTQLTVLTLTFDPISGNIFATTPSTDPNYPNSIVSVNPTTGAVVNAINVGAQPGHIAVSSDGAYAYTDVSQDGTIRRANLKTGVIDQIFTDGIGGVYDLEAVPGSPESYVVVTNPLYGVNTTVWDNGTARSGTGATGYDARFASDGTTLYGDGRGSLFVDVVTPTAINWTEQYNINASWFVVATNPNTHSDALYTGVPNVIDPTNRVVLESFPTKDFALADVEVSVSAADNRVYFMTWGDGVNKRVLSFDLTTYKEYPFFDTGSLPGGANAFTACGNHTVAFYIFGSGVTQNLVIVHGLQ